MPSCTDAPDGECRSCPFGTGRTREERVDERRLVALRVFDAKKASLNGDLRSDRVRTGEAAGAQREEESGARARIPELRGSPAEWQ
jgi:hypothetical protein